MKMKYKLYIVIFMVMCILPFAGMAVAKTETTTENRTMAAFPSFMEEGKWNVNYLQDLGAYFEDHYAFRNLLVSVDSQIQAKLFKTSNMDTVIVGKNDWLYYTASLDNYLGQNLMSDQEVYNAAYNLSIVQEYVQSRGAKFLVTVPPNKNSLYGKNMPYYDQPKVSSERNYTNIIKALKSNKVAYTDLYQLFSNKKETLYLKRDSHWNEKGSLLAYNALLTDLNKERLKDNVLLIHSSSNKTYDEEKVLELEAGEETVKKEHLYLNRAQSDSKKPTITSVKQKGKDAKTIVVTFSEDVLSADNKNNYSILRGGKHTYTVSEATYTSDNEKYQAKLVLNDKLVKGKYTVETHNIVDNTNEENPLDASWSGELDGEGAFKAFYTSLGKFWAIILAIIVFAVLLGIYLYIRKHRGIMVVQDKMVLGDKMEQKKHIKSDQSTTKNVILSVSGIAADEKEMAVQINGSIIIGRWSFCDIYFDDLKMSGQHFALLVQNGGIFLSDLNSTNGTFVDGKPVEAGPEVTVPVANGSTIEAGSVTFVIRW